MSEKYSDEIPEIHCLINIVPKNNSSDEKILDDLKSIGIDDIRVYIPKYYKETNINFAIVPYTRCWYLNEVIDTMFAKIEGSYQKLVEYISQNNFYVSVVIVFIHDERYPALEISPENVKKISELNAQIVIDAY